MFLEDRLRNVYIRSLSLLRQLEKMPCPSRLTFSEAADLIGYTFLFLSFLFFSFFLCVLLPPLSTPPFLTVCRCGTTQSDVHLFVSILQGVLPSSSFCVSSLREIGTWWVLVEHIPHPVVSLIFR
jgi:hypothetical protein